MPRVKRNEPRVWLLPRTLLCNLDSRHTHTAFSGCLLLSMQSASRKIRLYHITVRSCCASSWAWLIAQYNNGNRASQFLAASSTATFLQGARTPTQQLLRRRIYSYLRGWCLTRDPCRHVTFILRYWFLSYMYTRSASAQIDTHGCCVCICAELLAVQHRSLFLCLAIMIYGG